MVAVAVAADSEEVAAVDQEEEHKSSSNRTDSKESLSLVANKML